MGYPDAMKKRPAIVAQSNDCGSFYGLKLHFYFN